MARVASVLLAFTSSFLGISAQWCAPLGAVLPAPRNLSTHPLIQAAIADLTAELDDITAGRNSSVSYRANVTSSSIGLLSIYDEAPMFEHHHTAPIRNTTLGGTSTVNGDTVYRIASVSKLVTVLALLVQTGKVSLKDPVTAHIPELGALASSSEDGDDVDKVRWEEVTLEALASHVAGIGRGYSKSDIAVTAGVVAQTVGLPPLNELDVPSCSSDPSQRLCSREEFLSGYLRRHPVHPTFTTPAYSNAAFTLLGFVVEAVTNMTYDAAVEESIFKPLGMTRTSVTRPGNDSVGIIPIEDKVWAWDWGVENPSDGIYSSLNDQLRLGRGLLSSKLLSPAETRRWMKPVTHTASLKESVGAPWEIARFQGLTSDSRVIEVYSKLGVLSSYSSWLALVPDYGIVVMGLSAAPPPTNVQALTTQVLQRMLPVVDQVAREQASSRYAGQYISKDGSNSTLSLIVDNGPGLRVDAFTARGQQVLDVISQLPSFGQLPSPPSIRLYPTGLTSQTTGKTLANPTAGSRISFRAVFDVEPSSNQTSSSTETQASSCLTWFNIDSAVHGGQALDEFVFDLAPDGRVERIESRGWRLVMEKQSVQQDVEG